MSVQNKIEQLYEMIPIFYVTFSTAIYQLSMQYEVTEYAGKHC